MILRKTASEARGFFNHGRVVKLRIRYGAIYGITDDIVFLKVHSISYVFMAYRSAYLKANYRQEFGEIFTERRKELLCKDIT